MPQSARRPRPSRRVTAPRCPSRVSLVRSRVLVRQAPARQAPARQAPAHPGRPPQRHRWDRSPPCLLVGRPGHGSGRPALGRGIPTNPAALPRSWIIRTPTLGRRCSAPLSTFRLTSPPRCPRRLRPRSPSGRRTSLRPERPQPRQARPPWAGQGRRRRGPGDRRGASATSTRRRRPRATAGPPVRYAGRSRGIRPCVTHSRRRGRGWPRQNRRAA